MDKIFNIAVLGTGSRGRYVVRRLLEAGGQRIRINAAYDPDKAVMKEALENIWHSPDARLCDSYEEAINTPGVDWVMVFSPNAFHKEEILAAFAAGKHVFSEKPLATSMEDCLAIDEAHRKSGLFFATGFVLRYANIYRRVKELLKEGSFGKLLAIEANEHIRPYHGGYIMCNWRRLTKVSGPHILEKCCHDLDLINWFTDSLPKKVMAMGCRNFFIKENQHLMEKYGEKTFKRWWDPHALESPFTADSDLMDNTMAIAEFISGVRVSFVTTMSNALPERRMRFMLSEGTIDLDLYKMTVQYRHLGDEGVTTLTFVGDDHGGGDDFIMRELFETMSRGVPPKCSGSEGLRSAVFALAIDKAAQSGQPVDLTPIWDKLLA